MRARCAAGNGATMPVTRMAAAGIAALVCLGACSSDSKSSDTTEAGTTSPAASETTAGAGAQTTAAEAGSDDRPAVALPADWLSELALPTGVVPVEATDLGTTNGVVARIDGDVQAVFDTLKQQLVDAGYEIVGSTFTPTDQGGFGSISAKDPTHTVAIAFGPNDTGKINQVHLSVAEVEI